ncbi:acid-sensing ion channel 1-like [Haliotis rubra]|uniref:acid-sensing ion channel 1-like n=1 Tax=Haliotis rubra TaxID=36100 RepID=UPI001EE5DC6D|nr:acid-sensing ion channel 1-like [Haliotis rubra]
MSAYMSYNITKELMDFYRYPVITNTKVDVLEEVPFPAVTFCNQSPYNMSKVRAADPYLEEFFKNVSVLGGFRGPVNWNDPVLNRPTFRESKSLDWWKQIHIDPNEMLSICMMNGVSYEPCRSVMKPVLTTLGYCATFNWNASDVTTVRVAGSDNNLHIFVKVDQINYVLGSQLSSGIKYQYLPPPYQAFKNRTCVDTLDPSFNNTLEKNFLEIRLFYEDLIVQSTEQSPKYTTETLIGNLGGQMGICLGASILTVTELGEFLLIVCLSIFRRCKRGGKVKQIKPLKY